MRISVLLPTRDRLDLLTHAIASVTRLDDPDTEIVISDNCSSGDVEGYVESLDDSRLVYVRTSRLLSVTENWNNALAHSSGEYVVMLGDDDALLDGYFSRTRKLIADFDRPQVIYHNALGFAYPGVIPGEATGRLRSEGYAPFIRAADEPFRLTCDEARETARGVADFRLSYGFNMQFVTVARDAINELTRDGKFFHSSFPDYYAMNHLLACAHSIVVEPRPLVVIGISPRSYGFFFYNDREPEGRVMLEGDAGTAERRADQFPLMPGLNINNGWLSATEALYQQLGTPADFKPNYRRYRKLQILHVYAGRLRNTVDDEQLAELKRQMTGRECIVYGTLFAALSTMARVLPSRARIHLPRLMTLIARQLPWWNPVPDPRRYRDISDVVENVTTSGDMTRWRRQRGSRWLGAALTRFFP